MIKPLATLADTSCITTEALKRDSGVRKAYTAQTVNDP